MIPVFDDAVVRLGRGDFHAVRRVAEVRGAVRKVRALRLRRFLWRYTARRPYDFRLFRGGGLPASEVIQFEETVRGTIAEVLEHFRAHEPKGEFVLVVAGKPRKGKHEITETEDDD